MKNRITSKFFALALALLMALALLPAATVQAAEQTLVKYAFSASVPLALEGMKATVASPMGSDGTTSAGTGAYWYCNTWSVGGAFYFDVSATGYTDLRLQGILFSSATGPRNVGVKASTDGVTYATLQTLVMNNAADTPVNITLPATYDNAARVYFRFEILDDVSANGTGTISGTSAFRMGTMTLYGDGEGPTETPPPTVTNINTVTAEILGGTTAKTYTVKGKVTIANDGSGTGTALTNTYIQDATGGIVVRFAANVADAFVLGDEITVTGVTAVFNGLPQMGTCTLVEKVAGTPVTPPVVDLSSINRADYLCKFIRIEGAEITAIQDYADPNVTILTNGQSIVVYRAAMPGTMGNWDFAVGDFVNLTGALSINGANYQIRQNIVNTVHVPGQWEAGVAAYPAPTFSVAAGVVAAGTTVTLSHVDGTASIYYRTAPGAFTLYNSTPITINATTTIEAYAQKGTETSATVSRTYTVVSDTALNIKEALAITTTTVNPGHKVKGQLVYRYGEYGGQNTMCLQDTIDGVVYSIVVFPNYEDYTDGTGPVQIGDWVEITGDLYNRYGVPQIQGPSACVKSAVQEGTKLSSVPLEVNNFADLSTVNISRYVMIKDVKLGVYNNNGDTVVTAASGTPPTMNIYRASPYPVNVEANDIVDMLCVYSTFNANRQLRNAQPSDYIVRNDTKPPVITIFALPPAALGAEYTISVGAQDNVGVVSITISYIINGVTYGPFAMTPGDMPGTYTYTIPAAQMMAGTDIQYLVTATDAVPLSASDGATIPILDEPRVTVVTPAANAATGVQKRPLISATFENAGAGATVTMTVNGTLVATITGGPTGTISYTPAANMPDGKVDVVVKVVRTDLKEITFPWSFFIGEPQFRHYRGQLHSHTAQYSDGSGTLAQAFTYAKTAHNIDFLALTDHSHFFDNAGNLGSLTDATKGTAGTGGKSLWQNYKEAIATYTDSNFVALAGFEMTWSGQYGHINTFNSIGIESRNDAKYVVRNGPGLLAYYDRLVEVAAADAAAGRPTVINQFNHPGSTFGTFQDFANYTPAYDNVMHMIEVGNGEGKVGGSMYWPSYQYYTLALDKGWHLAPANNQDNHKGLWGDSNTTRNVIIMEGGLTEANLYEAMRNLHMYASEDDDLEVNFTLNGEIMGSILDIPNNEMMNLSISFSDPTDRVQKVSLIANGGTVIASKSFSSFSGTWDLSIPNQYSYYYVRVDQVDAHICVTAPIWTQETVKLGIASLTKNTVMEVKGEPITLTATLYNYQADETATVTKLEWFVDGVSAYVNNNPGVTLAPSSETPVTWVYPANVVGRHSVSVTATMRYKGANYTSSASIDFIVRDGSEYATMLIDAYHSNFYVSGNYAEGDVNFIALAAMNGVRASHITEPITDAVLANCDLLVLTVPFKGARIAIAPNNYTQAEIDAIGRYAARGGNIIVTSKSDRLEPAAADEKANVISNKILTAIGAKGRVGEGIVVDNVTKANESFRLYFLGKDNINFNSMFTEHLLETTNTLFSCYNGAPIILNGATPIVIAEDTAWVSSYDSYFEPSPVPPGVVSGAQHVPLDPAERSVPYYAAAGGQTDVVVMAEEILPGGGFLITAGVTFFSTFEVKVDLENATTLQNANYQLAVNIFRLLNPKTITPIANIHAAATENVPYTIEGYVTSTSSGHNQDIAFFDCIYLQDASGRGINVFPVSGDYRIGQKLRVTGMTASYMGEIELNCGADYGGEVTDITFANYAERADLTDVDAVMGANKQSVDSYTLDYTRLEAELAARCEAAKTDIIEAIYKAVVTPGVAVSSAYVGNYVEFTGRIVKVEMDIASNTVGVIHVMGPDGKIAIVFIDGYITCDCATCPKDAAGYHDLSWAVVDAGVLVRGISSIGQNSYVVGEQIGPRIRIRNRVDIEPILYWDALIAIVADAEAFIASPAFDKLSEGLQQLWLDYLAAAKALIANPDGVTQAQINKAYDDIANLSKTGETTWIFVICGIALLALLGLAFIAIRKRRFN
ncbi:MAG: CehA/McbA family metallohydrolase [Clostridiales bacterium]|nr:CehA/McbA family metallohydrolase [Clostridiales bacterium]